MERELLADCWVWGFISFTTRIKFLKNFRKGTDTAEDSVPLCPLQAAFTQLWVCSFTDTTPPCTMIFNLQNFVVAQFSLVATTTFFSIFLLESSKVLFSDLVLCAKVFWPWRNRKPWLRFVKKLTGSLCLFFFAEKNQKQSTNPHQSLLFHHTKTQSSIRAEKTQLCCHQIQMQMSALNMLLLSTSVQDHNQQKLHAEENNKLWKLPQNTKQSPWIQMRLPW